MRMTKNSAAVKLLKAKFLSGEVTTKHRPADVWRQSPVFQRHKLPTFRNCFHKIRREILDSPNDEGKQLLSSSVHSSTLNVAYRLTKFSF